MKSSLVVRLATITGGRRRSSRMGRRISEATRARWPHGWWSWVRSGRALPLALGLLALVLAFVQRPGQVVRDTRVELSVDPGLFLHRVASVWSSTTDLGHVQSGQKVGYLWPLAPYQALAEWLGLSTWVAQRLWLAALLGLAAWGTVRMMDELYDPRRGLAHAVAGVLYGFNPYVVTFVGRTSTLLAYAALPWLMVAAHRGLRSPRAWRWPSVIGLIVASAGGGVNAAVVAWVVVGPVALVVYEAGVLGSSLTDVRRFAWRTGLCVLVGSSWWMAPVLLQSSYGANFLTFTEQPNAILATPSMSESARLLGFWLGYFGFGSGEAAVPAVTPYLFNSATIVGSFAVPLLAFGALRWTRRWSYAAFFGLLGVGAVVFMALGFPTRSPSYDAVNWLYYRVPALQFLRTTYKAAPLLAVALAALGGAGAAALVRALRGPGVWLLGSRLPAWSALALLAVPVLWARPLLAGHAVDKQLAYGEVPLSWRVAIADVDRTTPPDRRAMILPGELFGWHRWGGTIDPVGPALARRPLVIRELDRYADPRSAELQVAVDDLVQQGRLVPGQLDPMLRLMGVGQVLVAADGKRVRNGALDPARVAEALAGQSGFGRPAAQYGGARRVYPAAGRAGPGKVLPDLRRYVAPGAEGPGIVRLHSRAGAMVLDGDAQGVVELAAVGGLDPGRALVYAPDLKRSELAEAVRAGAELVFTDSNRRRRIASGGLTGNRGPTLGPNDPLRQDDPAYNPFPAAGASGRTVAVYTGLRWLRANARAAVPDPDRRPYAALDGSPSTAWVAGSPTGETRYLELSLKRPLAVRHIDLRPHFAFGRGGGVVGIRVNGGPERRANVRPGRNRIPLLVDGVRRLRLRLLDGAAPFGSTIDGIAELRIPGLSVRESLRLPTDLADAARRLELSHNAITVALQRTTTDFPYRTGRAAANRDAEPRLVRDVSLPDHRSFSVTGWASVNPRTDDRQLDRLAGLPPTWGFASSSRFEGVPGRRASSAFDSDPTTAWVADSDGGNPAWLAWRSPRAIRIKRLQLRPGPPEYRSPSRLRIATSEGPLRVPVSRDGAVTLPRTLVTRGLRIEVAATRPLTRLQRARRLNAVAIGEVVVPGLRPPRPRRTGTFATRCGELTLRTRSASAPLVVTGSLAELDAGRPLQLAGCGARPKLSLPAGRRTVTATSGHIMRPDHLRLHAAAPAPLARAAAASPRVVDSGDAHEGRRENVKLDVGVPSWLVLGESYSRGWRAWCRDAGGHEGTLGAPTPIDGFANGWRVDRGCRNARFAFGPQRIANAAYLASLIGVVAMLSIVLVEALRRRRRGPRALPAPGAQALAAPPGDPLTRLSWPGTLALAATAGLAVGLLYGSVAGLALGAVLTVLGREGLSASRLLAVGALGLAAVPALYLAAPAVDHGGFNFDYAREHLDAHRVAAVALVCVLGACALDAVRWRVARRRGQAPADGEA
jgi:hypothetical protein